MTFSLLSQRHHHAMLDRPLVLAHAAIDGTGANVPAA
jgi:hypothetical protein